MTSNSSSESTSEHDLSSTSGPTSIAAVSREKKKRKRTSGRPPPFNLDQANQAVENFANLVQLNQAETELICKSCRKPVATKNSRFEKSFQIQKASEE